MSVRKTESCSSSPERKSQNVAEFLNVRWQASGERLAHPIWRILEENRSRPISATLTAFNTIRIGRM